MKITKVETQMSESSLKVWNESFCFFMLLLMVTTNIMFSLYTPAVASGFRETFHSILLIRWKDAVFWDPHLQTNVRLLSHSKQYSAHCEWAECLKSKCRFDISPGQKNQSTNCSGIKRTDKLRRHTFILMQEIFCWQMCTTAKPGLISSNVKLPRYKQH